MDFKSKLEKWNGIVNNYLDNCLTASDAPGSDIYKAMRYSLMAGGKRLRPVLALAVCELLNGDENEVLPFACAIEMIHTYSLIHDDLPAMDNDDYRRGVPTSHKVFGEAMAILAGDALLNKAFEVMLENAAANHGMQQRKLEAMRIIAACAGADGMIRGQVVDLQSEGVKISMETLEYMHRCKTGALIRAPILSAALLADAAEDDYALLDKYAQNLGLAFQIKDDIMDATGNPKQMGKASGKDAAARKSTYVTLLGVEKSEELLRKAVESALYALEPFGGKAWFLKELAQYVKTRDS